MIIYRLGFPNSEEGTKRMNIGQPNRTYVDITEPIDEPITTDDEG